MRSPAMGIVEPKGLDDLIVEGDGLLLTGFMFGQGNMRLEPSVILVIDIAPAEAKQIADPQRRTGCHDDHRMVAILAPEQEIVGEVLKLATVLENSI